MAALLSFTAISGRRSFGEFRLSVDLGCEAASFDMLAENMELYGSEGSLYLPDPNFFGGEVLCATQEGKAKEIANRGHPFAIPNAKDGKGVDRANYRCAGLADMAAAIAEDRPHRCSLELATHVVEVMTAILQLAERREWFEMVTTCARPDALTPVQARSLLA